MAVAFENGKSRSASPSEFQQQKKRITNLLREKYSPETEIPVQKVPAPVFCAGCKQAVVTRKDQFCPVCLNHKMNQLKVRKSAKSAVLLIGVLSGFILFFVFLLWFSISGK